MKRKRWRKEQRTSAKGFQHGATMAKLADAGELMLALEGEIAVRCKTCAFRAGTVPNGCMQTQMDITKAVLEHHPFMCHVVKPGEERKVCNGWFAAMQIAKKQPPSQCPWEYSPPDPE